MKTSYYVVLAMLTLSACKNTSSSQHTKQTVSVQASAAAKDELLVTVLPGVDATEEEPYQYPRTFNAPENTNTADLAAYGTARNVWLGPKGWTGDGSAATNGGKRVNLYPKAGEKLAGPHVVYYSESSCIGCMLGHAAKYFPQAMKEYNETYNDDGTNPAGEPAGLTVQQVAPFMVAFALPDSNGLRASGVVYYRNDTTETYFVEATFVLPPQQAQLSDALTKAFIARMSSDK